MDHERREENNMTSKVVLLPCEDYEENRVYQSVNTGIGLLGGWEAIVNKKEKILVVGEVQSGKTSKIIK